MVKRYNHFGRDDLGYDYDARADQDEEGDWVRYEDYAQLEAMLKEARGLLLEWREGSAPFTLTDMWLDASKENSEK